MNFPYKVLFENPANDDSMICGYVSAEKAKEVVEQFNSVLGSNVQATYLGKEMMLFKDLKWKKI